MVEPIHQWLTIAFLAFLVGTAVVYDVAAANYVGPHATISRSLLRFSLNHQLVVPIVSFIVGVVVGHIFLPQYVR